MASKAENPAKAMPRAIAGTLLGAVIFSGLAQLSLALMGPECVAEENTVGMPFEVAFKQVAGWPVAAWIVHIGEIILLPLVVLLSLLPQPEVTAAMAEDKLLPSMFAAANEEGVFVQGAAIWGAILTVIAFAVPFAMLWDVISLGVLLGFNLTNASLLMVRYGNGGRTRKKRAAALIWGLLASTGVFAYAFWLGVALPMLEGTGSPTGAFVWVSCVFFAISVIIMGTLRAGFTQIGDCKGNQDIFRAPGIPFVPGVAMMVNYIMMAQMPWVALGTFAVSLGVLFFVYIAYTGSKRVRQKSSEKLEDEYSSSDDGDDDSAVMCEMDPDEDE